MVREFKILLYEKELKDLEMLAWIGVNSGRGGDVFRGVKVCRIDVGFFRFLVFFRKIEFGFRGGEIFFYENICIFNVFYFI